jgi:formate-dependent nitrite reductase cytochrome c552 subunit
MTRKLFFVLGIALLLIAAALIAYDHSAPGVVSAQDVAAGPAVTVGQDGGDCTACHNDSALLTGPMTAWSTSAHGTNTSYLRGTSAGCAGCHSGSGFSAMVAAGISNPEEIEAGDVMPTRQDCRTCHNIHTTYTADDFSLETTDAVNLFAFEGATFDGGAGNLCASCHQPRRAMAVDDEGNVDVNSTHWGPHHGPQSALMIGVGGVGIDGSASPHMMVSDTCVTCHMQNDNHSFAPSVAACQMCHGADTDSFDIEGVQTQVGELVVELQEALVAKGLLDEEGEPIVGVYPEAEAGALWNYIFIAIEDSSGGVHNPDYTIALLEASIEALK